MNLILNAVVLYLTLTDVSARKIIKKVWIHKELVPGSLLHLEPLKEIIFPFGAVTVKHAIEKRDISHSRKTRAVDDIVFPNIGTEPDAVIETQKKIINQDNILTDITYTRVEYHRGKPVDAVELHSIALPEDTDGTKDGGIASPTLIDTNTDLEAQASSSGGNVEIEPVPLEIPDEGDVLNITSEKLIEPKEDVEIISKSEENASPEGEIKSTENVESHSQLEVLDITSKDNDASSLILSEELVENKDSEAVPENIDIILPKPEPIVEAVPSKPVEIPAVVVSPLPQPVYIPLYTEVKIPAPEVINAPPAVVVVTEKEAVPPIEAETTVIQTEHAPGLFTRGSHFMLNISSRILKKLLRLVSRVQSRLPAPLPAEA